MRPAEAATRRLEREQDERTIAKLAEWGAALASRFGLAWRALEAERDGVVAHYGVCFADGTIRIRLRHARTRRLLKESSLVDTLCHELAHLRHFDHSPRFVRFYRHVLDEARRLGYYRPGPGETRRPVQLSLFGASACGTVRSDRMSGGMDGEALR